jgi:hypothetical protein
MYRAVAFFPADVRRRVAERYGPFVPAYQGDTPKCGQGYCVMGALLREATGIDLSLPDSSDVVNALDQCGFLPDGIDERDAARLVARAIEANDLGKLTTPEAVRRFLGVRVSA